MSASSTIEACKTGAAKTARVAVLGATGYSGQEFVRLAGGHPGIELAVLCSRQGGAGDEAHPATNDLSLVEKMVSDGSVDTVVACMPHGVWKQVLASHPALGGSALRVVDLSSDFRQAGSDYVYGLPELFRHDIAKAGKIANPGCYPTAAALALLPAVGWIKGSVMIHAVSGVSGAGRHPTHRNSFVEMEGGSRLYQAGTEHPHVEEMERLLAIVGGSGLTIGFAPMMVPMSRGILLTASAQLVEPIDGTEAHAAYQARYATEPFVRVLEPGQWPQTSTTRGSNRCDVSVTTIHDGTTLLAAAAIDNLVKGAAGQALQNLNLMLGWPEDCGLERVGLPW